MKLSVNLALAGRYVRAGDELPRDFELPSHLEAFVVNESSQTSQGAAPRLSPGARQQEIIKAEGGGLAKSAPTKKGMKL
jgi:hypothetical protein